MKRLESSYLAIEQAQRVLEMSSIHEARFIEIVTHLCNAKRHLRHEMEDTNKHISGLYWLVVSGLDTDSDWFGEVWEVAKCYDSLKSQNRIDKDYMTFRPQARQVMAEQLKKVTGQLTEEGGRQLRMMLFADGKVDAAQVDEYAKAIALREFMRDKAQK